MVTIHKFRLDVTEGMQSVSMPIDSRIISCQLQQNEICLWAIVDTTKSKQPRNFCVFGTGHLLPNDIREGWKFIATVQQGCFVWHIFEY